MRMETVDKKRKETLLLAALLLAAMAILLYGNARVGLFESSEARYAEVAREMTATGDYLSPQVDYVYHFTKPPVAYWFTALGYELFGMNTFGARFFLALAAVLVLALTARLWRLARPGSRFLLAPALLFFSLEFFAMGKVVTTDMYLTLWITLGFLLWSSWETGKLAEKPFRVLFGLAAALAFLTKGPVPILFWAVVLIPYALWTKQGRRLTALLSPWFWVPFLAVALPWFVTVGLVHPGLLHYLLAHESAEAVYSAKRFHPGPWYYYGPILLAGFLPWWLILAGRWRRLADRGLRLWLIWAVVPVLVWSLFPAKLPTYILPTMPAWALLAAGVLERDDPKGRVLWSLVPLAAGGLGGAALWYLARSPGLPQPGIPAIVLLAACTAAGLSGALFGLVKRPRAALCAAFAAMALFQLSLPNLCVDLEDAIKIRMRLGHTIAALREPGEPVLEYKTTLFSIPFYVRDRVAAYDNNFHRKKYLDKKTPAHILQDESALRAFLRENPMLWVVTDRDAEEDLARAAPGLRLVMRQGPHSLWAPWALAERHRPLSPASRTRAW